ncbi:MAG: hypothetical protein HQM14_07880 [SAR324 cluster bacterium]|nr:hypothetical protein [SAR324 cluster bacterium]
MGLSTKPLIIGQSSTETDESPKVFSVRLSTGMFAAASSRGTKYKNVNEDRLVILPQLPLFAVIDGMGGPGDGAKAADILTEELMTIQHPSLNSLMSIQEQVTSRIKQECMTSNSGVCYLICWMENSLLHIYYLGDVKLTLFDNTQNIKWESRDHSLINSWIDSGYLSPEKALHHPQRHIITKALTGNDTPEPDSHHISFETGDRMIAATDGLSDNFTMDEIAEMTKNHSPQESTNMLMQKTITKMQQSHREPWDGILLPKPDNISILIGDLTVQ